MTLQEPSSVAEAEKLKLDLIDRVSDIQAQLGLRDKLDAEGRRLSSDAYWDWRRRAVGALKASHSDLRRLNAWIKAARRREMERVADVDLDDPRSLIKAAYNLFKKLVADEVELDPDEQAVVDALREHIDRSATVE